MRSLGFALLLGISACRPAELVADGAKLQSPTACP